MFEFNLMAAIPKKYILCKYMVVVRHGVNSITELELLVNSNSGIGSDCLKKLNWNSIGIEHFGI